MPPEGSDLVLSTDVPHGERDVLVFDSLDVEAYTLREREIELASDNRGRNGDDGSALTDGGNGGHDLSELKLVENGGLTGGIESDHENSCWRRQKVGKQS